LYPPPAEPPGPPCANLCPYPPPVAVTLHIPGPAILDAPPRPVQLSPVDAEPPAPTVIVKSVPPVTG